MQHTGCPASYEKFREPGGDDGLTDAALALQDQMNGGTGWPSSRLLRYRLYCLLMP